MDDTDRLAATGKILAPRFFPRIIQARYVVVVDIEGRRDGGGEGAVVKRFSRGGAKILSSDRNNERRAWTVRGGKVSNGAAINFIITSRSASLDRSAISKGD